MYREKAWREHQKNTTKYIGQILVATRTKEQQYAHLPLFLKQSK